jgi:uncharacterized protein (DUF2249 family)
MKVLDVSTLEPPEPMELILKEITKLAPKEHLQVLHRMEPYPLYPILEQRKYKYTVKLNGKIPVELIIWHD